MSESFLDKLGDIAAEKIVPKLVELLWPKLQDFLETVVLPKVLAIIPTAVASAVKAVISEIPGVDLVKPVEAVANDVLEDIKDITGIDIPGILGGFRL